LKFRRSAFRSLPSVAASLASGGPVVRGQLIASHFYEALQHELKQSAGHDTTRAALIAAGDRCARIAAASINPSALLDELTKAIAVRARSLGASIFSPDCFFFSSSLSASSY
jgi:hypothetical protein